MGFRDYLAAWTLALNRHPIVVLFHYGFAMGFGGLNELRVNAKEGFFFLVYFTLTFYYNFFSLTVAYEPFSRLASSNRLCYMVS